MHVSVLCDGAIVSPNKSHLPIISGTSRAFKAGWELSSGESPVVPALLEFNPETNDDAMLADVLAQDEIVEERP